MNTLMKRFELTEGKLVDTPDQIRLNLRRKGTQDEESKPAVDVPYRELIGAILYISNGTRQFYCKQTIVVLFLSTYGALECSKTRR